MKRHIFLSAALIAGSAFLSLAQTHKEGEEYYRADQFDNAKELLQRNYNNPGTDKSMADYYLGMIALEEKNKNQASEYFQKGLAENPENGYNYVGMGQIQLLNGDAKAAKKYFDDARKKNKKDASLDIAIARAYYDVDPTKYATEISKMQDQARKDSPKEAGIAPTNIDIYLFEGDVLRDNKDWGNAGSKYEMAKNYNPNATEAYVKYGILFRDVRPSESIKLLSELLQVNPNSALGQRELARTYYNQQDYKKAVDQYAKYVNNPNHFKQDEDDYSLLLFFNQDFQRGYDFATKLLNENPSNFTARRYQFINAANIDSMKDQLLPMAENLLAAHKSDNNNKFAQIDYILIGGAFSDAGRYPEAQALFEEAIADAPENAEYYRQLANVFVNEEKYDKAGEAYSGYINNSKTPTYGNYNTAATYYYYGGIQNKDNADLSASNYNKAKEMAEKSNQVKPNARAYKLLGDIAKQTATEDQAKVVAAPFYFQSLEIVEDPNNPDNGTVSDNKEMYTYIGNYYLNQNDNANAIKYFNKYLELDPDNESYRKFVNGLKK